MRNELKYDFLLPAIKFNFNLHHINGSFPVGKVAGAWSWPLTSI